MKAKGRNRLPSMMQIYPTQTPKNPLVHLGRKWSMSLRTSSLLKTLTMRVLSKPGYRIIDLESLFKTASNALV